MYTKEGGVYLYPAIGGRHNTLSHATILGNTMATPQVFGPNLTQSTVVGLASTQSCI